MQRISQQGPQQIRCHGEIHYWLLVDKKTSPSVSSTVHILFLQILGFLARIWMSQKHRPTCFTHPSQIPHYNHFIFSHTKSVMNCGLHRPSTRCMRLTSLHRQLSDLHRLQAAPMHRVSRSIRSCDALDSPI
jgi:hypothetical protein